jgi:hypothetical protein
MKFMKSIKQFGIMLSVIVAIIMSSCSGDDNGGGGGGSASLGKVTAKASGKNFKSYVAAATKNAIGNAYMIGIQASDENGTAIQLVLTGVDGQPGTFQIGSDSNISVAGTYTETQINLSNPTASTYTTWAAPYENSGVVGSITITEITETNIKGNFEFKGKNQAGADSKQVSNGAFNLNFQ